MSKVTNVTPKITNVTPKITNVTPKITNEMPKTTNETPKTTNETPKITNEVELMKYADQLPTHVLQDIDKRIGDWLASGGTMDDPYIQQQYRYAENVLNRQAKEVQDNA